MTRFIGWKDGNEWFKWCVVEQIKVCFSFISVDDKVCSGLKLKFSTSLWWNSVMRIASFSGVGANLCGYPHFFNVWQFVNPLIVRYICALYRLLFDYLSFFNVSPCHFIVNAHSEPLSQISKKVNNESMYVGKCTIYSLTLKENGDHLIVDSGLHVPVFLRKIMNILCIV